MALVSIGAHPLIVSARRVFQFLGFVHYVIVGNTLLIHYVFCCIHYNGDGAVVIDFALLGLFGMLRDHTNGHNKRSIELM